MNEKNIKTTLNRSKLWGLLTEKEKIKVQHQQTLLHYKKNQLIYKENDKADSFICVLKGKVKIYLQGLGNRAQIVRIIKPIGYFGYRAFFANENYVTRASATEESILLFIPMRLMVEFITENPQLAIYIIQILSQDLGIADERTLSLTQKHIRGRLAESLLLLKDTYGVEEDGMTLAIFLSREDLASLSNMTPSNATRTLTTFVQEKLIVVDGRKIIIINESRLRKISHLG